MGKTDLLFLTLHWEMAVPPSGDPSACCGEPGGAGVWDRALSSSHREPRCSSLPWELGCICQKDAAGEVSPWVFLRDFCVQTRLAGCACRKEIKGEKRSPADTYKALTTQEHSLGSLRFLFCLLFENNFTSKLVHRL